MAEIWNIDEMETTNPELEKKFIVETTETRRVYYEYTVIARNRDEARIRFNEGDYDYKYREEIDSDYVDEEIDDIYEA